MRFSITNALLALAIHSSIASGRALPQTAQDCENSLQAPACSDSLTGCAPESALQIRAPPPPKFGDGTGDGDGDGSGTDTSTSSDTGTGDGDTEGPITGNQPHTTTPKGSPGNSPHDSTGNTPPPRDPNQALALQNPKFAETKGTFRETIDYLGAPRSANDPTPRLPEGKGLLWSAKDENVGDEAQDWAAENGYVSIAVLRDMPGNLASHDNNEIVDEYFTASNAGFSRALKGEVQIVADAEGLGADNMLAKDEWPEMMEAGLVTAIRWRDASVEDFSKSKIIWTIDQGKIPPPIEGIQRIDQMSGSHQ